MSQLFPTGFTELYCRGIGFRQFLGFYTASSIIIVIFNPVSIWLLLLQVTNKTVKFEVDGEMCRTSHRHVLQPSGVSW